MRKFLVLLMLIKWVPAFAQEQNMVVLIEAQEKDFNQDEVVKVIDDGDLKNKFQWAGIRGDFNYAGIVGLTAGTGFKNNRLSAIISGGFATAGNTVYGSVAKGELNFVPFIKAKLFYISGKYYHVFVANQTDMNFLEGGFGIQSKNGYMEIGIRSYVGQVNENYNLINPLPSLRIGFKIWDR